jgi:hypothetical protein
MTRGQAVPGKVFAALLGVCALGLLDAGIAASAEPSSMAEARAMGDPAASAPVHPSPDVRIYKGEEISEATWAELDLACMQTPAKWVCKDSVKEFKDVAATATRRKGATASACDTNALWLWRHKQYEGESAGLNYFYAWWDMPTNLNNDATSYRTGEGAAHLSDFGGGGGFWYPGNTGYCSFHSNISQPYPEWNDRISSRYRF